MLSIQLLGTSGFLASGGVQRVHRVNGFPVAPRAVHVIAEPRRRRSASEPFLEPSS